MPFRLAPCLLSLWRTVDAAVAVDTQSHLRASTLTEHQADPGILWGVPQQPATYPGSRDDDHQWLGFNVHGEGKKVARRDWENYALETFLQHYGNHCNKSNRLEQCTEAFVCRDGRCLECEVNRDCQEEFKCVQSTTTGRKLCVPRDLAGQWSWREFVATILIIITAMLSAAAGMGGGGVYVPLLLLLLGLSTKEAVPLSQAMIVGGAVVNVLMFCGDRHPMYPNKPRIDYEVIMMMFPGLAAGVMLGIVCHLMSPQWLIVSALIVTLGITFEKTWYKGIAAWKKESEALAAKALTPRKEEPIGFKIPEFHVFQEFLVSQPKAMGLIAACWTAFLLLNCVKAPQCTALYWVQMVGLLGLCYLFTMAGIHVMRNSEKDASGEGVLNWTPTTLWQYPLMAVAAGFLGGFLGIGGGIIMGPLLLELGMTAEANQATTALFVFLSSSLATIQFIFLDKIMPHFVIWFTAWVVVSTVVGQIGIDYMLRKYKRSSIIVLSIAGIVGCSLIMMSLIGLYETYNDIQRGANMNIKPHRLCES